MTGRPAPGGLVLEQPLGCRYRALNSPAHRVPSHGTHLMGTTCAIDLVPVDERGLSAPPGWRSLLATEAPQRFVGFGAPVLAPCPGAVLVAHDGEADHAARRSAPHRLAYALTQTRRVGGGAAAVAGNHVVIAAGADGVCVLLAHLRSGSVRVRAGDRVETGDVVAECGNSGNSTEPHVHLQASDSTHWSSARGIPFAFSGAGGPWLPDEGQVVVPGR